MTTPVSRLAYAAEYELLDQALASEKGVQRLFPGKTDGRGQAFNFRVRLHQARTFDRHLSKDVYEPGHDMYGQTPYSVLICKNPYWDEEREAWVLQIVKNDAGAVSKMIVEEIQ